MKRPLADDSQWSSLAAQQVDSANTFHHNESEMTTTRRDLMSALFASGWGGFLLEGAAADVRNPDWIKALAERHDKGVESLLQRQITDKANPHCGIFPDATELYQPSTASGILDTYNTAFHHPLSKFHKNPLMIERMRLAADYLNRVQTPDGNIDNIITNWNSPPDTAFTVLGVARVANIAKKASSQDVLQMVTPFLDKAGKSLARGGVHTPNHRWVVCSALALLNEVYPNPAYVKRVNQWLAEGIDIDEDGQFDERSTIVYSPIVDIALITVAAKLGKKELLEPVRKNLDLNFYLMHADGEMVTEISHRQDRNQVGDMGSYWFPMHYMALHDNNPRYAWVAQKYLAQRAGLSLLLEYPELTKPLPQPVAPPDNYEKVFKSLGIARIRRGDRSATLLLEEDSRFFTLHHGGIAINAVRFASAFFGKAQFEPQSWTKDGDSYVFRQSMSGPYYQPLENPYHVKAGEWGSSRKGRKQTEVSFLEQRATVTETANGFRIRMQATGTSNVPLAVEVSIRGKDGLEMDGLLAAPGVTDGFVLPTGYARVRAGGKEIRFGPGRGEHKYTQVRGAEAKLPGASVYITGYTPFDHTLEFVCASA